MLAEFGDPNLSICDPKDKLQCTVDDLKHRVALDIRRVGANIALERSLVARMGKLKKTMGTTPNQSLERLQTSQVLSDALAEPLTPPSNPTSPLASARGGALQAGAKALVLPKISTPKAGQPSPGSKHRDTLDRKIDATMESQKFTAHPAESVTGLKEAFESIAASFDIDGDGTLNPEEILHILGRCQLYDEVLTSTKVSDFFKSWAVGCNQVLGEEMDLTSIEDGIGWEEFEILIKWCSDMKGLEFERCAARVIRLSRKLCDGKSSDRRRLKTVFEAYCKSDAERLNAYEFSNLCESIKCFERGKFATGDSYHIFYRTCQDERGVTFDEFLGMLEEVGNRLGIGDKVYPLFAAGVSKLDVDEADIRRIKLRMKHAASAASSEGWRQFFRSCDTDNSGNMDWEEFYDMCKTRLNLPERENHIKIIFEKLDLDDSGELAIDELIEFIEQ
eukprot:TRINITY_DN77314_c0_g1_i1.p1 TRINITY_DN77314_c0_g1~~TRINITY_DN77314_c0_g1_i1.p1  ORF type:complete len:448 (-),score=115.22 TRINITY_DN77314_c0_g1_i1:77-1420(-)